jgi:hypothetical protein
LRNTLNRVITAVCTAAMAMLVGCAPSAHLKLTTKVLNFGMEFDQRMINTNLVATVAFDEVYPGNYGISARSALYIQGIEPDSPEYLYRVARTNLRLPDGFLWKAPGDVGTRIGAMVPDHIAELKAWDLVEIRQTGTYDTMKNFSKTGEGNAILRVLCRRSDPGYDQCADALPRIGSHRNEGSTGTPFLNSLKDYGFTFTPAYTAKGERIRAF